MDVHTADGHRSDRSPPHTTRPDVLGAGRGAYLSTPIRGRSGISGYTGFSKSER